MHLRTRSRHRVPNPNLNANLKPNSNLAPNLALKPSPKPNPNANPNPNPNPNPYQDEIRTFEGEPHPTSPFEGIALMDVVLRMARLQGEADCPRTGRELLEMTRAARYW